MVAAFVSKEQKKKNKRKRSKQGDGKKRTKNINETIKNQEKKSLGTKEREKEKFII